MQHRGGVGVESLSIIVPVLNEAAVLERALLALGQLRAAGVEVIVVDGGSADRSAQIAAALADRVLVAPRGRARQMNAGAALASGDLLLFLHADTFLPGDGVNEAIEGLRRFGRRWGRFDVRLSGEGILLRVVEALMNLRSRATGICTGDQAMFVERALFREVGGYADMLLMEDVDLCRRLKRHGAPLCLRARVVTSSRRWEERGVLRTIVLMWWLRLAYFLGVAPERLARFYR